MAAPTFESIVTNDSSHRLNPDIKNTFPCTFDMNGRSIALSAPNFDATYSLSKEIYVFKCKLLEGKP
jgi:hypothetical protein